MKHCCLGDRKHVTKWCRKHIEIVTIWRVPPISPMKNAQTKHCRLCVLERVKLFSTVKKSKGTSYYIRATRYGQTVPVGHGFHVSTNQIWRGFWRDRISWNRPDCTIIRFLFRLDWAVRLRLTHTIYTKITLGRKMIDIQYGSRGLSHIFSILVKCSILHVDSQHKVL